MTYNLRALASTRPTNPRLQFPSTLHLPRRRRCASAPCKSPRGLLCWGGVTPWISAVLTLSGLTFSYFSIGAGLNLETGGRRSSDVET